MKTIEISLKRFDLQALHAKTLDFLKGQVSPEVDPSYGFVWVESPGEVPSFGPESGWDVLSGLKREGKTVFFPFARIDLEGMFVCADGSTYGSVGSGGDEDEMLCGEEDEIGFLLNVRNGVVTINSAIIVSGAGPFLLAELFPDCGILDEPMDEFIREFISLLVVALFAMGVGMTTIPAFRDIGRPEAG